MSPRGSWMWAAVAAAALAGCGEGPSAKFVLSQKTSDLDRAAKSAIETELQKSFGDPNHLVAWRKLPIDFGEFDGEVIDPTSPLVVKLARKADPIVPLKDSDLRGAAIVWTSGANANAMVKDAKGKEQPVDFRVGLYDSHDSKLTVAGGELQPVKKGDKFSIIGTVLQHGRKSYMTHCMHCHGVSGDGNGPTAKYLSPLPRDYRPGVFKFTSTKSTDRARREDLKRTVRQGIPGTYMPSFLLLGDEELASTVEYVRWLSNRGEFEQKADAEFTDAYSNAAIAQRVKDGEKLAEIQEALAAYIAKEFPPRITEIAEELNTSWTTAEQEDSLVTPKKTRTPDSPESRERGRKLYNSDTAKCATCHGPLGHGDGPQTEDFQTIPGTTKKFDKPGLFDNWGNAIKPRDLTTGIYRGGRRPVDIYRRIHSSIKGTPMPPFGSALNDEQIWDIVNYVMSLPYSQGSPHAPQQPQVAAADSVPAHHGEGK